MKKLVFKRILNETYGFNFYFCNYKSTNQFVNRFKALFDMDFYPQNEHASACCISMIVDGVACVVVWVKTEDYGHLAHECVHAVNKLMDRCGIGFDHSNDEPQAYLVEWLFRKCQPYLTH